MSEDVEARSLYYEELKEEQKRKIEEINLLVQRLPNVMYDALDNPISYEKLVKELKEKLGELLKEVES